MIKKNGTQKPRKSQNNAGPLSFREFREFCVRLKGHTEATDGHGYSVGRIKAHRKHGEHRKGSHQKTFREFCEFCVG